MSKGVLVVQSRPSEPGREAEYNEWYGKSHIPDICAIPGFVSARRYKVHNAGIVQADSSVPEYMAIYDLDTEDVAGTLQELVTRFGDGRLPISDALELDPLPVMTFYELME